MGIQGSFLDWKAWIFWIVLILILSFFVGGSSSDSSSMFTDSYRRDDDSMSAKKPKADLPEERKPEWDQFKVTAIISFLTSTVYMYIFYPENIIIVIVSYIGFFLLQLLPSQLFAVLQENYWNIEKYSNFKYKGLLVLNALIAIFLQFIMLCYHGR